VQEGLLVTLVRKRVHTYEVAPELDVRSLPAAVGPRLLARSTRKRCEERRGEERRNPSRGKKMQGTGREGEHHLMRRGSLPLRGRQRRSGGGGGGAPPLDLTGREERSDEWGTGGVLPDVYRPGAIPRGNWAHSGRNSLCSGLPKMYTGLHGYEFRVGCQPGK